ncbi:MAG: 30S ribosomal protein S8 [Candidatus Berkelbacteria bacterium]|nr:30S ribosomal protein S8 [Candidatus Berkelbacteria bacterium]
MDPISEMLTTIRNGQSAGRQSAEVSYSRVKEAILKIFAELHFIAGFEVKEIEKRKILAINFAEKRIENIKRISKPGRRKYIKAKDIRTPLTGLGYMIISTPRGLMESRQARKLGLGGEVICEIW